MKNWQGVPIVQRPSIVTLSAKFLVTHVIPPHCKQLCLIFENKLLGFAADKWLSVFSTVNNYTLKIEKLFASGFYILQIMGENCVKSQSILLEQSPILCFDSYACFLNSTSPLTLLTQWAFSSYCM